MKRAKSICRHPNCNVLLSQPGHCPKHKKENPLRQLRTNTEAQKFYKTYKWRRNSELFRYEYPLCMRCKMDGKTVPAKIVHHKIEVPELIKQGKDPIDWKYLESICFNCHQKELRKKRGKK